MVMEAFIRDEHGPVRLDLTDFHGGWTLFAFFPPGMAAHPELAALERLRRRFADEDCLVVAASIDSWWQLRDAQASFPLVADTHALLAMALGAYDQGDARFGWVLLDPTGEVRESSLGDGPCATCALDTLRALRDRPRLRLVS
jgi:alkyl hydroperoxide reductase subunit AhpC